MRNGNGSAYYQWRKLCERADVKCNIHQLRHTTATELVNSGVGVGTVRQLLGHRNLQITQCYAELGYLSAWGTGRQLRK